MAITSYSGVVAPTLAATGVTGTGTVRLVGSTTAGAPTSGTYSVGDVVVGRDGSLWVCTTAGTPGTWTVNVAVSGGPHPFLLMGV